MIRVHAASRLHFGLLGLPLAAGQPGCWPDLAGQATVPARRFGGVGLMVESPGVQVGAEPAAAWSAEGPLSERALAFARRFEQTSSLERAGEPPRPHRLVVEHTAPEHVGLGTGTQLGLAVARVLAPAYGLDGADAVALARRVGRGARSALGVHGFARGGFLVEGGKRRPDEIAPLVTRAEFPESWRVVLVLPPWGQGLHGAAESRAFDRLGGPHALATTEALCRLVLLGMLPALAEHDLAAFGEALYDFNRRVGEAFRPVQGGTYANPRSAEIVAFVRSQGIWGVGQSSWGPAVFTVVEDPPRADDLGRRLRQQFGLSPAQVLSTSASRRGAAVL
jgi:beta-RFAP synthase